MRALFSGAEKSSTGIGCVFFFEPAYLLDSGDPPFSACECEPRTTSWYWRCRATAAPRSRQTGGCTKRAAICALCIRPAEERLQRPRVKYRAASLSLLRIVTRVSCSFSSSAVEKACECMSIPVCRDVVMDAPQSFSCQKHSHQRSVQFVGCIEEV